MQISYFFLTFNDFIHKEYAWITSFIGSFAKSLVCVYAHECMFEESRRDLSNFFRGWQFYTHIVLVPSMICAFGFQAGLAAMEPCSHLLFNINFFLCTTPILLILLLTTADDSFSSKSHKKLVRNLSVLMVADLFDAIEMLDNAFESCLKAFDVSMIFLVIGAIITVIVSSLRMVEYEFIEVLEVGPEEQIRFKPNVSHKIVELVINVAVLITRLTVLIEHGKIRPPVIIKNFIAIILCVMHICTLRPRVQALKDV